MYINIECHRVLSITVCFIAVAGMGTQLNIHSSIRANKAKEGMMRERTATCMIVGIDPLAAFYA